MRTLDDRLSDAELEVLIKTKAVDYLRSLVAQFNTPEDVRALMRGSYELEVAGLRRNALLLKQLEAKKAEEAGEVARAAEKAAEDARARAADAEVAARLNLLFEEHFILERGARTLTVDMNRYMKSVLRLSFAERKELRMYMCDRGVAANKVIVHGKSTARAYVGVHIRAVVGSKNET